MANYYVWSKHWQETEREAKRDIEQGKVKQFDSAEDFLADLEQISTSTVKSDGDA